MRLVMVAILAALACALYVHPPLATVQRSEVLVRTTLLSLDPASRAWMQGATYRTQLNPGDVMAGWGLGEVVSSNAKGFEPGDLVSGEYGWQQHAALPARALTKHAGFRCNV